LNGCCKDQHARLLLEESITLKLWLEHLGLELPPASTLSDNLNAVSNDTRRLIHDVQLRYILQGGLDDFQKCFIDSTAVEANTERPTDSTILVRLIARVRATGGNLHRLDVCERRVMEQEKVPVADKIISLSDSDASFIVKGGWNTEVGYRPQLARSGGGFVTALVLPRGNAADSPHLVPMAQEQITNTGVIPSMVSADHGYSTQQGLEELLGLGVKVVSISGAKGKKIIEAQKWKSQPYRQARAERSAMESLLFTLKESFEFGEMMRRTHKNVLAEMLEKVLAYNISQIIRVQKKLSEPQEMQRAAA